MSILAKRFKTLDQETNLPVADFLSANSSDLLNSANLDSLSLDADMKDFFENGLQLPKLEVPKFSDDSLRITKNPFGTIKDLSKLSSKDIDAMIGTTLPDNPVAQNAYKLMAAKCKTQGMNRFNMGKPYDPSIDCGGKKRRAKSGGGCSSNQFGNVMNKLTNGQYGAKFNDLNSTLRNLVGLASFGYKMNMCGVFSALSTSDMGKGLLSRASGSLLGNLGASKNMLGFLDLAGASVGLHTLKEAPSGLKGVMKNFNIPKEIKQKDLGDYNNRFQGASELFDPNWNKSDYDGMLSGAIIPERNSDFTSTLKGSIMSNRISEDNLFARSSTSDSMLALASRAKKATSSWSSLLS